MLVARGRWEGTRRTGSPKRERGRKNPRSRFGLPVLLFLWLVLVALLQGPPLGLQQPVGVVGPRLLAHRGRHPRPRRSPGPRGGGRLLHTGVEEPRGIQHRPALVAPGRP